MTGIASFAATVTGNMNVADMYLNHGLLGLVVLRIVVEATHVEGVEVNGTLHIWVDHSLEVVVLLCSLLEVARVPRIDRMLVPLFGQEAANGRICGVEGQSRH